MPRFKTHSVSQEEKDELSKIKKKAETRPFHALKILRGFIQKYPNNIDGYIMLGELCVSEVVVEIEGEDAIEEARIAFQQVIKLCTKSPAPATVYFNLASISPDSEAVNLYQQGISIATAEYEAAELQGKTKAVKRIKREIVTAYASLAETYQMLEGDEEDLNQKSESCFNEAIKLLPSDPSILQAKANFMYLHTKKLLESIKTTNMTEQNKQNVLNTVHTMREEIKGLMEASCSVWADRIDELMERGM